VTTESKPSKAPRKRLGDRLVDAGLISAAQLSLALEEQRRTGEAVGEVLRRLGFVREEDLSRLLAEDLGVTFVRLADEKIDTALRKGLDEEYLANHALLPLREERGMVTLAMARPSDVNVLDHVQRILKKPLRVVAAAETEIRSFLRSAPSARAGADGDLDGEGAAAQVNAFLARAVREGATDIHVEPEAQLLRLRFRVDGVLRQSETLTAHAGQAIVARIKVMAGLDIAEHRRPQDGRFSHETTGRQIDLRVSTIPTRFGENVVLRILDRSGQATRLDQLGLPARLLDRLRAIAELPHGLLLVTGPTGSGKTTTLYSLLASIDALQRKVATIEDPIEADLPLIRQSQVDTSVGFGFAEGLRSLLRQDPDVILVGEVRDRETADIALRASLTGHFVYATLHTNDAASAPPRLIEMGLQPFLLSASLRGVLAQRLVRRVCNDCATDAGPAETDRELFGTDVPETVRRGTGCSSCGNSGYRGRLGVYELLEPNAAIRRILLENCTADAIRAAASPDTFHAMAEDGKEKIRAGLTTSEEVLRVTLADD